MHYSMLFACFVLTLSLCYAYPSVINNRIEDAQVQVPNKKRMLLIPLEIAPQPDGPVEPSQPEPVQASQPQEQPKQPQTRVTEQINQQQSSISNPAPTSNAIQVQPAQPPVQPPPSRPGMRPFLWPGKMKHFFSPLNPIFGNSPHLVNTPYASYRQSNPQAQPELAGLPGQAGQAGQPGQASQAGQPGQGIQPGQPGQAPQHQQRMYMLWRWKG